jgi:hypothetical protein
MYTKIFRTLIPIKIIKQNFQRHILIIILHLNNKYIFLYIILTKTKKLTKQTSTGYLTFSIKLLIFSVD